MGLAMYVSLERELPDAPFMDGKMLAQQMVRLDKLARKLAVPRLSDFLGMSGGQMEDLIGDDLPEAPEAKWFQPSDGLAVVTALLTRLREADPSNKALGDLELMEQILQKAQAADVRWHLACDF